MRKHIRTAMVFPLLWGLSSCWGGPSKAELEQVFGVEIEYVECAKASGQPGYECSGKTELAGEICTARISGISA